MSCDEPITDLKELGLEAGEGTADAQVQLLPSVHRQGLVFVGCSQVVEGRLHLLIRDSAELGTVHLLQQTDRDLLGDPRLLKADFTS